MKIKRISLFCVKESSFHEVCMSRIRVIYAKQNETKRNVAKLSSLTKLAERKEKKYVGSTYLCLPTCMSAYLNDVASLCHHW
jgi:hypothetical protein